MKKILQLQGLDCAGCAAELERQIQKIDGVTSASIAFVTQKLTLEYATDEALQRAIQTANAFEEVSVSEHSHTECQCGHCHHEHEHTHEHQHDHEKTEKGHKREWLCIILSACLLALGGLFEKVLGGRVFSIIADFCFVAAYFIVGFPVIVATIQNLRKGRIFDENFLMTVASVGAMIIGETGEGVMVMLLYQLGELLQSIAVGSSRRSVEELMKLKSEWATVLIDGRQKRVKPETLQVGDIVLVKKGERVPVDGILLSEEGILDTKSLTGESEFKIVKKGDEILSGCINEGGMYEMSVARLYEESAVSRILDMVENAAAGKAKPEKFITKFAKYYTPIVCCMALVIAVVVPFFAGLIAGEAFYYFKQWQRFVQSALTFLVISCPCALIISVPLTYFSGIGACAKSGVLVKGATYLDVIAQVKIAAFDKTGTLTAGDFEISETTAIGSETAEEMLALAAAAERVSAHPIARAFADIPTPYTAENVTERIGRGLIATVNGDKILVGTATLLRENGISVGAIRSPYTVIFIAKERECLGYVEIGDKLRSEAKETIAKLGELGIERTVMLTGDVEERSHLVAHKLGIKEICAGLLPDQKLQTAEELKKTGSLLYVGDGINDAPVMAMADCAASMGKLGSAAAVEASDMVLISDNLSALPKAIKTARKTRHIVMQNIIFSIVMKVVFMALGLAGVLPLWLAVFADVGVMLLAVLNSFRVRK